MGGAVLFWIGHTMWVSLSHSLIIENILCIYKYLSEEWYFGKESMWTNLKLSCSQSLKTSCSSLLPCTYGCLPGKSALRDIKGNQKFRQIDMHVSSILFTWISCSPSFCVEVLFHISQWENALPCSFFEFLLFVIHMLNLLGSCHFYHWLQKLTFELHSLRSALVISVYCAQVHIEELKIEY